MYTLLCYFRQLSASILFIVTRDKHKYVVSLFVERGSARVPCVCSSSYNLSEPIELKLSLLTYHADAQVVNIQYSVTLISITFFICDHRLLPMSHDIDCW